MPSQSSKAVRSCAERVDCLATVIAAHFNEYFSDHFELPCVVPSPIFFRRSRWPVAPPNDTHRATSNAIWRGFSRLTGAARRASPCLGLKWTLRVLGNDSASPPVNRAIQALEATAEVERRGSYLPPESESAWSPPCLYYSAANIAA